jgi:hypothetical protein
MSRLMRLALASALLLCLCACDVLFMGRYSADLGQATAYADLSAGMSAYAAPSFSLSIVPYGDTEYVLLFSSTDFDTSMAHLYVLSPDLAVLNTYSLDDLTALSPAGSSFSGTAAMTHLSDNTIIIGNVVAVPADGGLSLSGKITASVTDAALDGWAIEGPSTLDFTCTDFSTDYSSQTLTFRAYLPDWSGYSTVSCSLGESAQIRGVFTDPTDADGNVAILALQGNEDESCRFFTVAKSPDIASGLSGYTLFKDYSSVVKDGINSRTIAVTATGIVAYDDDARAWIWFTLSAPDDEVKLPAAGWDTESRKAAFSFKNGWYCVWDAAARTLTRYEKWW